MSSCVLRHEIREEATHGLLCDKHRHQLDGDSREIENLIVDTQRIIDGGAPREAGPKRHVKKPADPPAPADLTIMSLYDARTKVTVIAGDDSTPMANVLGVVSSWMLLFAEERPLTKLPSSVLGQLDLMRRHHDWASAQTWVDDYALELTELRRALKSAVHDQTHTLFGYCDLPTEKIPRCGGALLVENGSDVIRCARCRSSWITPQEQARLSVRQ